MVESPASLDALIAKIESRAARVGDRVPLKENDVASGDEVSVTLKPADLPKQPEPEEKVVVVQAPEAPKRFSIMASFGTNVARVADTGVPCVCRAGPSLCDNRLRAARRL